MTKRRNRSVGLVSGLLLFVGTFPLAAQPADSLRAQRQAMRERHQAERQELHEQRQTQRQLLQAERAAQRQARRDTLDGAFSARCSRLELAESVWNFGDVRRKGGDLHHDFRFRNTGNAPLVVLRVVTSCSCVKASFSKRPVPAGGEGVIRITYEPLKSDPGVFNKVLQIFSNAPDGRQLITVQGNSLEEDARARTKN